MKSISHQESTETTSQTRTDRAPRAVTSAPPGALTPDLPQGPHRHLSPSLRVAHPTLPLSFMVAVWAACGMCCLQQQSGMGHWNSKATVTTDRMLGGSRSQDKTGIDLTLLFSNFPPLNSFWHLYLGPVLPGFACSIYVTLPSGAEIKSPSIHRGSKGASLSLSRFESK